MSAFRKHRELQISQQAVRLLVGDDAVRQLTLCDDDPPDAMLRIDGALVGLELTTYVADSSAEVALEVERAAFIRELDRACHPGPFVRVQVARIPNRRDRRQVVHALARIAVEHTIGSKQPWILRDQVRSEHQFVFDWIVSAQVSDAPNKFQWGWAGFSANNLIKTVERKSADLARWSISADQRWLIIHEGDTLGTMVQSHALKSVVLSEANVSVLRKCGFDRVCVLTMGRIHELRDRHFVDTADFAP